MMKRGTKHPDQYSASNTHTQLDTYQVDMEPLDHQHSNKCNFLPGKKNCIEQKILEPTRANLKTVN